MEGLREDVFLIARDMGIAVLPIKASVVNLVKKVKENVFPRASEEAELFRIGQVRGGILPRQSSESIISYVKGRHRCWRMITELGPSTQLSEPMRAELMIEFSGIS